MQGLKLFIFKSQLMVIAVTGHRPNKLNNEWSGKGPLSDTLYQMFREILGSNGCTKAISGMALGVDMLFAEAALSLSIPLIAAVPFKGQESVWSEGQKQRYYSILKHPLTTVFTVCDGGYASWKMQKRNEWMVNNCNMLVSVFDGTPGGTANCVEFAKMRRIKKLNIDPKTIKF